MNLQQLKKYILYSILFAGLMLLIFISVKNIPDSKRAIDRQNRELQKLKDDLFDCGIERKEEKCTTEEVNQIQDRIRSLEEEE